MNEYFEVQTLPIGVVSFIWNHMCVVCVPAILFNSLVNPITEVLFKPVPVCVFKRSILVFIYICFDELIWVFYYICEVSLAVVLCRLVLLPFTIASTMTCE